MQEIAQNEAWDEWREQWRPRQKAYFLGEKNPGVIKAIAVDLHVDQSTVHRWKNAEVPLPLHRSWELAAIRQDYSLLQQYANDCGRLITPQPSLSVTRSAMLIVSDIMTITGRLLGIADKIHKQKHTEADLREVQRLTNQLRKLAQEMDDVAKEKGGK